MDRQEMDRPEEAEGMNVVETQGLGKRYRRTWALRDCSLAIPEGSVVALVGPNGAGKTTLLNLMVGLIEPTLGRVCVLGGEPAGSARALDGVGFVAQDAPLYQNLSVADTLRVIASLNRRWDQQRAQARLAELGIPMSRRVGRLSGGQQAQLALTLALARQPRLLVLDEPLAMLDPLARFDFMDTVMTAASADGLSVVLSSHVLAELERVATYLIVLADGQLQLAGQVGELLARHRVLTGPAAESAALAGQLQVVHTAQDGDQARMLIAATDADVLLPAGWREHPPSLEETALAYLRGPAGPAEVAVPASTALAGPAGVTA
jgi:ABC-2 type transport system ATP-binding protein